uniref:hypothetical protein n=1 Tax=uncultured Altererythrobacter sp. TaxID=500840 RepID=UPI002606DDC7|nr:hypothetical protein [uncultured Altererythrobacter sp.]
MLTIALAALFTVVALGSVISLTDSALKWRNAYHSMKAEMALDRNAAVRVNEAAVVTLRTAPAARAGVSQQVSPAHLAIAA